MFIPKCENQLTDRGEKSLRTALSGLSVVKTKRSNSSAFSRGSRKGPAQGQSSCLLAPEERPYAVLSASMNLFIQVYERFQLNQSLF